MGLVSPHEPLFGAPSLLPGPEGEDSSPKGPGPHPVNTVPDPTGRPTECRNDRHDRSEGLLQGSKVGADKLTRSVYPTDQERLHPKKSVLLDLFIL